MWSVIDSMSKKNIFLILLSLMITFEAHSGVKPIHTREVIGQDGEYKVDIVNTSNEKYLVQFWLEDLEGDTSGIPVVLTPPMFEIDALGSGFIRLMPITSGLTKKTESVYWLNIQEIPRKLTSSSKNQLKMAVRTRIKVFIRPEFMSNDGLEKASKSLTWKVNEKSDGLELIATNASPYYLSMGELEVISSTKSIQLSGRFKMVPPNSIQKYEIPEYFRKKELKIRHGVINDYGGVSVVHENYVK